MTYAAIYTAIEITVRGVLGSTPVQLANQYIDTSNSTEWARITHLPAAASPATLGSGGQNDRPGLTQVDVFRTAGTGPGTLPDDIVATFPHGLTYSTTGGDVYGLLAYRDGGSLVEDGWWMERVVIQWRGLTAY